MADPIAQQIVQEDMANLSILEAHKQAIIAFYANMNKPQPDGPEMGMLLKLLEMMRVKKHE